MHVRSLGSHNTIPAQSFVGRFALSPATEAEVHCPGGSLSAGRAQRDLRVRLDAGHSSSTANLQAAFSAAAVSPNQTPQRSGSDSITFPRILSPTPNHAQPAHNGQNGQPPGSGGLFGRGSSAFSTTLWPQQGQNGISGTHQMWG